MSEQPRRRRRQQMPFEENITLTEETIETIAPKPEIIAPSIPRSFSDDILIASASRNNPNLVCCPDCGQYVSNRAEHCIHCGAPLKNPLEKLIPQMDQLWETNQDQECLNICNEILFLDPKNYVTILRRDICRRHIENDVYIGLDGYLKAVSFFNETVEISPKDAERFALAIERLFSHIVGVANTLDNIKASVDSIYSSLMNPLMPTFGPKADAARFMYHDAKNSYRQKKDELQPMIEEWTKAIYCNYPKRLAEISKKGKEVYEYIAEDAVTMNDSLRETIEREHPELFKNQNNNNNSSGGCYIATCVYGSYDCPQVWTLRRYRDYTLAQTWYGRVFIYAYYAISPKFVRWFGNTMWFKNLWKPFLDSMVQKLNMNGIEDTAYTALPKYNK